MEDKDLQINMEEKKKLDSGSIFTKEVKPISPLIFFFISIGNSIKGAALWLVDLVASMIVSIAVFLWDACKGIAKFFWSIVLFFKRKCHQFLYNDWAGRLSYVIFGVGSLKHGQIVNGIMYIVFEVAYIILFALFGAKALAGIGPLGPVIEICETTGDPFIGEQTTCTYQNNSVVALVSGIFVIFSLLLFAYIWNRSINSGYTLYRIKNFQKFKRITNNSVEFSDKISKQAMESCRNKVSFMNFKKEIKPEIDQYLDTIEDPIDRSYTKYLINGTISKAYKQAKEEIKLETKISRAKVRKQNYDEMRASQLDAIQNKFDVAKSARNNVADSIAPICEDVYKDAFEAAGQEIKANDFIKSISEKINENFTYSTAEENKYCKAIINNVVNSAYQSVLENNGEQASLSNQEIVSSIIGMVENGILEKQEIITDKHKNRTLNASSKKQQKIDQLNNKYRELCKRYSCESERQNTINNDKYGKFNNYYKEISNYNDELLFWKNYNKFVDIYVDNMGGNVEKNEENRDKIQEIIATTKEKIAQINEKFDGQIQKRVSVETQIKVLKDEYKAKVIEANDIEDLNERERFLLEAKTYLVEQTTRLNRALHDLPTLKLIKSMRKEEIGEVQHASNRDRKYLKTNFTSESYSLQCVIDSMLVDYKIEYKTAVKFANRVFENKGGECQALPADVVKEKIEDLEYQKQQYELEHEDKYVGKPKSFGAQVRGLLNENFHITILMLPLLGILFVSIIPLVFSILVAFTNFDNVNKPPRQISWIGLNNFMNLFAANDALFGNLPSELMKTLSWTLVWAFFATFSNYFLGIIVALMINKDGIKFKKLWRTIFVLTIAIPQFISLLSIGSLLKDGGLIGSWYFKATGTLLGFGASANSITLTKTIIILVNIWVGIPYTILSTTGILLNIPKDLYESSRVDGAGPFTQFFKITMPYILFVTGPYLITQFVGNFNNFNVIFFLTGGNPPIIGSVLQVGQTDLLITFLYDLITSKQEFGMASTVGIFIFMICAFFSIIMYNKTGAIKEEDQFQ